MQKQKFDEIVSYFNKKVSEMEIETKYKMELLGMVTALGCAHEKETHDKRTETHACDLISRRAAIDVVAKWFRQIDLNPDICIDSIISLPSVQPETNCSEFPNNSDTISRQAAIDAVLNNEHSTDITLMGDAFGKGYTEGYKEEQNNVLQYLADLPSAEPEIIRCKECKHYYFTDNRVEAEQCYVCGYWDFDSPSPNGFCSFAERRKDA
jgi:hypothetical protein